MKCPKCGEEFIVERTQYPYTACNDDSFDPTPRKVETFVTLKMYYNLRYIRMAIEPIFAQDSPDKVGKIIVEAIQRISQKECEEA